jgi:CHRD domain-containing protein
MKARSWARWVVGVMFLATVVGLVAADEDTKTVRTKLTGLAETPATINSPGSGEFTAAIIEGGTMIKYVETYRDLSSAVTQSHIHFGRPGLSGQIVLFLCTNLTPPMGPPKPQACPLSSPATISGTLTEADVIASPVMGGQGIDSGAAGFAEMVKAITTGSAYVNVHTTNHPSGEIRGRLGHPEPIRRDKDRDGRG